MEAVSAAASILAIAGAGIQISLKLIAFADQVGTAPKRIQDVGKDVSVTAGTLQELGELMQRNMPNKNSIGLFNPDQVQNIKASSVRCKAIFDELKNTLAKASKQLRDVYKSTTKSQTPSPKIKLSTLERMRWPFLQPSMKSLQSALRDAKGTLTLILQVVHLRHAHTTASLNQEEQKDLIRMIAAMRRQQLASAYVGGTGNKGLDPGDTEDSDSGDSPEVGTILEAWSVTPNTLSGETFQHFLVTQIPISQQQMEKSLKASSQDFRGVASMIDSLSFPERDAILGRLLGNSRSHPDDSTIRSISSQSWTGSHDLFGKVTSRKFKLIIERRVGISSSSRTNMKHKSPRATPRQRHRMCKVYDDGSDSGSDSPTYDSFSDSERFDEPGIHGHHGPPMEYSRRRPPQAPPMPSFERKRPSGDDNFERKQATDEKMRKEHTRFEGAKRREKEGMAHQRSHPRTEPQPGSEPSDDDLVKSLLAQYTNFDLGEPLVQAIATPPPTYEEAFPIPKRVPRPY